MKAPGNPERAGDAEALGNAEETSLHIESIVLAGVNDVETGSPQRYGGSKLQDARIKRTAHRDPRRRGRNA